MHAQFVSILSYRNGQRNRFYKKEWVRMVTTTVSIVLYSRGLWIAKAALLRLVNSHRKSAPCEFASQFASLANSQLCDLRTRIAILRLANSHRNSQVLRTRNSATCKFASQFCELVPQDRSRVSLQIRIASLECVLKHLRHYLCWSVLMTSSFNPNELCSVRWPMGHPIIQAPMSHNQRDLNL